MYYGITFYIGQMMILFMAWQVSCIFLMTAFRLASQLDIVKTSNDSD